MPELETDIDESQSAVVDDAVVEGAEDTPSEGVKQTGKVGYEGVVDDFIDDADADADKPFLKVSDDIVFKDADAAVKSFLHANKHIDTLEGEAKEWKKEREGLAAEVAQLKAQMQASPPPDRRPPIDFVAIENDFVEKNIPAEVEKFVAMGASAEDAETMARKFAEPALRERFMQLKELSTLRLQYNKLNDELTQLRDVKQNLQLPEDDIWQEVNKSMGNLPLMQKLDLYGKVKARIPETKKEPNKPVAANPNQALRFASGRVEPTLTRAGAGEGDEYSEDERRRVYYAAGMGDVYEETFGKKRGGR